MDSAGGLAGRIERVQRRIAAAAERSGRPASDVTLVAVTKTQPPETVREAYELGLTVFGENRVQEAREKCAALDLANARWELIGHLQSNKAALAVELFDRIQSVDSLSLAEALERRAAASEQALPVLLEVNVAGEMTKSGFAPEDVIDAARAIAALPHLRPEGLMTVAPIAADLEEVRPVFKRLRGLAEALRESVSLGPDGGWRVLSMGMTDDFEVAIEEGATVVRVGRALFGERPLRV